MNTIQKGKKRVGMMLMALCMALALVVTGLPGGLGVQEAQAGTGSDAKIKVSLGNAKYYEEGFFGYEKAHVIASVPIYTLEISVDKGKIFQDTKTWGSLPDWTAHDLYFRSVTWKFDYAVEPELIQEIIQNLKIGLNDDEKASGKTINGVTVTIRVDGNYSYLPSSNYTIKAYTNPDDGKTHYYMHVAKSSNISWTDAYAEAKTWTYMGLKGYLATLTSRTEDDYLDGITLAVAWAGGARILDNDETKELLDKPTLKYLESKPVIGTSAWVWTCGPEAGQYIYLNPGTNSLNGNSTSDGSKRVDNSLLVRDYCHWAANEPNTYNCDVTGEWCLEVHHGTNHEWNDYKNTESVSGYFVEFSDYPNGHTTQDSLGNPITYDASSTVADTFSINHIYSQFSTEGNILETKCDDGCRFTPELILKVNDGEAVSGSNPVAITPNGYWAAFVGQDIYSTGSVTYKGVDVNYNSTTKPTKPGNYKAYQTVTIGGKNYELVAEFSIDNQGIIHDEASHVHKWKVTEENGSLYMQCVSKYGKSSDCKGKIFKMQTTIDEDANPSSEPYVDTEPVTLNGGGEIPEGLDLPTVTKDYIQINPDTGTKIGGPWTTAPKTAGTYWARVTYHDPETGNDVVGHTEFTIAADPENGGALGINKKYRYEYSGTGLDRSKGYILFGVGQKEGATEGVSSEYNFVKFVSNAEVGFDSTYEEYRNYAHNTDGSVFSSMYIDVYNNTFTCPDGLKIAAYKLRSNGTWTVIKENKDFVKDYLPKILNSGADTLTVTTAYDSKAKKSTGTEYYFSKMTKPGNVESLKACYDRCADDTGVTNGQFVFMTSGATSKVRYNIGDTYEISFAPANSKEQIKWTNSWGLWPTTGGVWVPDAPVDATSGVAKPTKYTFFLRIRPSVFEKEDGTKTYTPASKVKKMSIATVQKAPKLTVSYGKKLGSEFDVDYITVKKGTSVYFGNAIPNPLEEEYIMDTVSDGAIEKGKYTGKTVIAEKAAIKRTVTDYIETGSRNVILAWSNATASKPASLKQTIRLYERKAIAAGTTFTPENGKIKLTVGTGTTAVKYEIKDGNKWKASLPNSSVVTTRAFEIRLKNTAKSGKEAEEGSDALTTSGTVSILEVVYDKDDAGKKIIVKSAVVKDKTE